MTDARAPSLRVRAVRLLEQNRELLAAVQRGEVPGAGPAYRHRVEGAVTALEALLGLPSSLVADARASVPTPSA